MIRIEHKNHFMYTGMYGAEAANALAWTMHSIKIEHRDKSGFMHVLSGGHFLDWTPWSLSLSGDCEIVVPLKDKKLLKYEKCPVELIGKFKDLFRGWSSIGRRAVEWTEADDSWLVESFLEDIDESIVKLNMNPKLKVALVEGGTDWNIPFDPFKVSAYQELFKEAEKLSWDMYDKTKDFCTAKTKRAVVIEKIKSLLEDR